MFDADKSTVMEVPGVRERPDEVVGLPDFPTQLSHLQMRVPELSF